MSQILDQKLGNVGEVKVEIVAGKLVVSVDAEADIVAQIEKLKAAHGNGILGAVLAAAEVAVKALSPAAPQA
jgi:hypothetical protein